MAPPSTNYTQPTGDPPSLSSCRGHPVPVEEGQGAATPPPSAISDRLFVIPDPDRGPIPSPTWERVGACPVLDAGVRAKQPRPSPNRLAGLDPVPTVGQGRAWRPPPPTTPNQQATHPRFRRAGDTRYPWRRGRARQHPPSAISGPRFRRPRPRSGTSDQRLAVQLDDVASLHDGGGVDQFADVGRRVSAECRQVGDLAGLDTADLVPYE